MQPTLEERIKEDIRSGESEASVRAFVERQGLDEELTQFLLGKIDDEVAIQKLREIKLRDANLIVYMGYFLMLVALFFGTYSTAFGAAILVVGFFVVRRGRNKTREAQAIDSIEELLPKQPTKFHKRRI